MCTCNNNSTLIAFAELFKQSKAPPPSLSFRHILLRPVLGPLWPFAYPSSSTDGDKAFSEYHFLHPRLVTDTKLIDYYLQDISHFPKRSVLAVVFPISTTEVQQLIKINYNAECPLPIYPVSSGRNWGLGSRSPVTDGCVIFDLGLMQHILHVDTKSGVVVLEPGVTQLTLSELLPKLGLKDFCVNVTASCADTSIIGNACDRGVGFIRQRTEDIRGLEVVLGNGELMHVGSFWSHQNESLKTTNVPISFHYKHGTGPDMLSLFLQTNYGIVTAAAVSLIPKPECLRLVEVEFRWRHLRAVGDLLARLYREGILTSIAKIYDTSALLNYGMTNDDEEDDDEEEIDTSLIDGGRRSLHEPETDSISSWSSSESNKEYDEEEKRRIRENALFRMLGSIQGRTQAVDTMQAILTEEFNRLSSRFANIKNDRITLKFHDNVSPDTYTDVSLIQAYNRFSGIPTCEGHRRNFGSSCDLDIVSPNGWLFFLPVIPLSGEDMAQALLILGEVSRTHSVRIGATVNVISNTCVDLVCSIHFDKDKESIELAHRALDELHNQFAARHYFSYREDLSHQCARGSPTYKRFLVELKKVFDSKGILSPGRYVSLPPNQDTPIKAAL
jgi:4-cresol dehydrogenase (hydroxylating)